MRHKDWFLLAHDQHSQVPRSAAKKRLLLRKLYIITKDLASGLARLPVRILWCVHMRIFSLFDRMNSGNTIKMLEHKLILFATVTALFTFVTSLIRLICVLPK